MYEKAYGIIETLAPLHVGASSGEETGNINLIFRDQFTLTGIIPGSSIRGRFRADMRLEKLDKLDKVDYWYGKEAKTETQSTDTTETPTSGTEKPKPKSVQTQTTEAIVKFEHASIVWIPVYCPGQPVVYISSPSLLKRYQKITGKPAKSFEPYSYCGINTTGKNTLFFNLGFLPLGTQDQQLNIYTSHLMSDAKNYLFLVVRDTEISMIHDMALYRQTRVQLEPNQKIAANKGFFNVEALPEGTILVFPLAMKRDPQNSAQLPKFCEDAKFLPAEKPEKELYFGGLESIGFGRTKVALFNFNSEANQPQATSEKQ